MPRNIHFSSRLYLSYPPSSNISHWHFLSIFIIPLHLKIIDFHFTIFSAATLSFRFLLLLFFLLPSPLFLLAVYFAVFSLVFACRPPRQDFLWIWCWRQAKPWPKDFDLEATSFIKSANFEPLKYFLKTQIFQYAFMEFVGRGFVPRADWGSWGRWGKSENLPQSVARLSLNGNFHCYLRFLLMLLIFHRMTFSIQRSSYFLSHKISKNQISNINNKYQPHPLFLEKSTATERVSWKTNKTFANIIIIIIIDFPLPPKITITIVPWWGVTGAE